MIGKVVGSDKVGDTDLAYSSSRRLDRSSPEEEGRQNYDIIVDMETRYHIK